jgi:hydroxymethylpyrimidine/phosphomethylpyrimidine kinase
MDDKELMSETDIHAFGVEIVFKQLEEAEWLIHSADALANRQLVPQIIAVKGGETGHFVVRTAVHPERGKIEGQGVFEHLVKNAREHGASCYFASVSIANSKGRTDEEMSVPLKGVPYHVAFDGLVKMELPD